MNNIAYIGIGTNIGQRQENLKCAIEMLSAEKKLQVLKISSIYETAPVGYVEQDAFLNLVVKIETELEPLELLNCTSSVENEMGRERLIHWGPRIIDLDILMYFKKDPFKEDLEEEKNSVVMDTEKLSIPHPRIGERAFVLVPLIEISPNIKLSGLPLNTYLFGIPDQEIKIWSENL